MTSSAPPAIVIAAHNRPTELQRLCRTVAAADIAADTTLVISIDGGGQCQGQVRSVADEMPWPHGPLSIVEHDHLGLVDHFHWCGNLTESHDAIVLLEDDLIVGPAFQRWAAAGLRFAATDARIAGVSLATPFFDGYRHLPFEPILDGGDGVFAQVPWYDGMAWTAAMWDRYRSASVDPQTPLHGSLATLGDDEWFPDMMRYLVGSERYFLLPRHAHATNSGAAGAHFAEATDYFQVPLTLRGPRDWHLIGLDDAMAVYDDHLELTPDALGRLWPGLSDHGIATGDIVVDLAGVRDLAASSATYALTTRQVHHAEAAWAAALHPLVANVALDLAGDAIRLAKRTDVDVSAASDAAALATLRRHAARGRTPSGRQAARQVIEQLATRTRRGR